MKDRHLKHYRLVGRQIVECDMLTWALDFEDITKRRIAHTPLGVDET